MADVKKISSAIKPGDVVRDRFSARMMTVDYIHGDMHHCVWFEGSTLHRNTFKSMSVEKAAA